MLGAVQSMPTPSQGIPGKPAPKKRGRKRKNPELTEDERALVRKLQNRESAKLSRVRRKVIAAEYEEQISELVDNNKRLHDQVTALNNRLSFLQSLLTVHVAPAGGGGGGGDGGGGGCGGGGGNSGPGGGSSGHDGIPRGSRPMTLDSSPDDSIPAPSRAEPASQPDQEMLRRETDDHQLYQRPPPTGRQHHALHPRPHQPSHQAHAREHARNDASSLARVVTDSR
jgi:Basic region leucine zipper